MGVKTYFTSGPPIPIPNRGYLSHRVIWMRFMFILQLSASALSVATITHKASPMQEEYDTIEKMSLNHGKPEDTESSSTKALAISPARSDLSISSSPERKIDWWKKASFSPTIGGLTKLLAEGDDPQANTAWTAVRRTSDRGLSILKSTTTTQHKNDRRMEGSGLAVGTITIADDQVWTASDSPVEVSGVVTISNGGTLTIEEGVQVIFSNRDAGINNEFGALLILGSPSNRVLLEPLGVEAGGDGEWRGIDFSVSAVAAAFTVGSEGETLTFTTGSIIKYANVVKAGTSSHDHALDFSAGAAPYLFHVNLIDCGRDHFGSAIYVRNLEGYFVARYVSITKDTSSRVLHYGIYVQGNGVNTGYVLLDNVGVQETSRSYALYMYNINTGIVQQSSFQYQVYIYSLSTTFFQDCTVSVAGTNNRVPLYIQYVGYNSAPVVVTDNHLVASSASAQYGLQANYWYSPSGIIARNTLANGQLYLNSYTSSNLTIEDNLIQGSKRGGIYFAGYGNPIVFRNNTVSNCHSSSSYDIVYLRPSSQTFHFVENVIQESSGRRAFYLEGSSSYSSSSTSTIFERNVATGNTATSELLYLANYPWTSISDNIFNDTNAPFSVRVAMNSFTAGGARVTMPGNHWGNFQDDIIDLRNTVYDALTSITAGPIVEFQSVLVLGEPSLPSNVTNSTELLMDVDLPGLYRSDGSIGGIVSGNGTYVIDGTTSSNGTHVIANASIIVLDDGCLILEAGVNVTFATNRGIAVFGSGKLAVNGTMDDPVHLLGSMREDWYGLEVSTDEATWLSFALVEGATDGIVHKGRGALHLYGVTVSDTENGCVWSSRADSSGWTSADNGLWIENSNFERCGSDAILVNRRSVISIIDSAIHDPGRYGLYTQDAVKVNVEDSYFEGSNNWMLYFPCCYSTYLEKTVVIARNIIFDSRGALWLANYFRNATVSENEFVGKGVSTSSYRAVYVNARTSAHTLVFEDNMVEDWILTSYEAVYISFSQSTAPGDGLLLQGNVFSNVRARQVLELNFPRSYTATDISNTFESDLEATDTSHPALFYVTAWPSNSGGDNPCTLVNNIFNSTLRSDTEQYYVKVDVDATETPEIDASRCYWGTVDEEVVVDRIYDGRDSVSISTLRYLPYLLTEDIDGPVSPNTTTLTFLRDGSVLSGILPEGENVTLTAAGSPYRSEGSLLINGRLTIEHGVIINMDADASLIVQKGHIDIMGSPEAPVLFEKNGSDRWDQILIQPKFAMKTGFKMLLAYTDSDYYSVGEDAFNQAFEQSDSVVLYRHCPGCSETHRNIFYKRLTNVSALDMYDAMTCNWPVEDNVIGVDFELYGSIQDLENEQGKWSYCYPYPVTGRGFPGYCGVSGASYEYSQFLTTCTDGNSLPSSTREIYWLLYDTSLPYEEHVLDWFPSQFLGGIPAFLQESEAPRLNHIKISGCGSDTSHYPLEIKRSAGSLVYNNISITDSPGGGIYLASTGSFQLHNLRVMDDSTTLSSNPLIGMAGTVDVVLVDTILNMRSNVAVRAENGVRLDVNGMELRLAYAYQYGLYLANSHTKIKGMNLMPSTSINRREAVYLDTRISSIYFSMADSFIDSQLMSNDVMELYYYYYSGSVQGSRTIRFENNTFTGGPHQNRLLRLYSYTNNDLQVFFVGNEVTGGNNYYQMLEFHSVDTLVLLGNSVLGATCRWDCWYLYANHLRVSSNVVVDTSVGSPYSLMSLQSHDLDIQTNEFVNNTGYSLLELRDVPPSVNFTENVVQSSELQFYVETTMLNTAVDLPNGVLEIGPNFWDTNHAEDLYNKTFDSRRDSSRATVTYPTFYVDPAMTQLVNSPPPRDIVDTTSMTISGTIVDEATVLIPAGEYHALGSIVLSHPNAELVVEAGVHIEFVSFAGIRVYQGTLKILGTDESPVLLSPENYFFLGDDHTRHQRGRQRQEHDGWVGVWFGPDAMGTTMSSNIYVSGSIIRHCSLYVAGYTPTGALSTTPSSIYMDRVSVMLDHVIVAESGQVGIKILSAPTDLVLDMVTVSNPSSHGFEINSPAGLVVIQDCTSLGSSYHGLHMTHHGDVSVFRSSFDSERSNGRAASFEWGAGELIVSSCTFANTTGSSSYGLYVRSYSEMRPSVTSCSFSNTRRALYVQASGHTSSLVTILSNEFSSNSASPCSSSSCNFIEVLTYGGLLFNGNVIEGSNARRIVRFYAYSNFAPQMQIEGNLFGDNAVPFTTSGDSAVVMLGGDGGSSIWELHGNAFNNLASSFEISTSDISNKGSITINATHNFFTFASTVDSALIDGRIYDDEENDAKPEVLFEPFLSSNTTFSCPGDCSGEGTCVFPGYCICKDGWGGIECSDPTCLTLDFCSVHGNCIDYDVCECDVGWFGAACAVANCTARNDCSGNGFCPVPNVCSCDTGYAGDNCDECTSDFRLVGGECVKCPVCLNGGTCNDQALCDCPENYAEDTCTTCATGFFGLACLPFPYILTSLPTDAIDEGGVEVRVTGFNFGNLPNNETIYKCRFGGIEDVDGTLIADDELSCLSPVVELSGTGLLNTYLQVFVDAQESYNTIPFTFYGVCPDNQCDKGFCSFGRCQCYYGYRGENCDEALVAPVISTPPGTFALVEGDPFSYQATLEEGTTPIDWAILGIPVQGMSIDASSGLLSWNSPVASTSLQYVQIQATNELTRSTIQLALHVRSSYYVTVTTDHSVSIRPAPAIFFDFQTINAETDEPVGEKLAVLWVYERGTASSRRRKLTVKTDVFGRFRRFYQPYGSDAGAFIYGGEHPTYSNLTEQGGFSILGIDVSPISHYFRGFPGEPQNIEDAFTFRFRGGKFSNITATFDEVEKTSMQGLLSANSANETDDTISMSLQVEASTALSGRVYFILWTEEGASISSSYVYVDIRFRRPTIRVAPSSIDVKVERGGAARYEDVVLENIGSLASNQIEVIVPDQAIITPVVSEFISGLAVDEATTISFQFQAAEEMEIGSVFTGIVGFASNSSDAVMLNYRATVVSSVPAILTVVTQNEATFLSEEKPNLADVDVRVRSLNLGTTHRGSSGANGTIVFDGLFEDFYEVYAQKLEHSSFRQTIYLEAPGSLVEAFLQFEAVSYTFSVVPIPVVDKYEIVVETTFRTTVPKPVIIWDPVTLDWEAMRSGLVGGVQFSATNLGLIAADDLTFTLPGYWENVAFIAPAERNLGRLPANSSVSFPVEFVQINRYELPDDRAEMRGENPNDIIFTPRYDDPKWDTGPDMIVIPADNPNDHWYYKFDAEGKAEFAYSYADGTRYDFVYNGTEVNGTEIPVDVVITNGTNLTETSGRRLDDDILPPIRPFSNGVRSAKTGKSSNFSLFTSSSASGERFLGVNNPLDCAVAVACEVCRAKYGSLSKVCKFITKYTSVGKYGVKVGVPTGVVGKICKYTNPCNWVCPDPINVGGCVTYECNGPQTICFDIKLPDTGDCSIDFSPSPAPRSAVTPIGLSIRPCPRCGSGTLSGGSVPTPCRQSSGSRRRLQESGNIPSHVVPYHRALLGGCEECSSADLKTVFQETDKRQAILLEAETLLKACVDDAQASSSVKSIFPCILRQTFEFVDLLTLLSEVLTCQSGREACYSSSDISESPGLANLLIQAGRFKSFVDLSLLPFGGSLSGNASSLVVPYGDDSSFNPSQAASFATALVNALADNSEGGEFIAVEELTELLDVGLTIPDQTDIVQFAATWNHSLALWEEGTFRADDLPANYSNPFFDLEAAGTLMSMYLSARASVRNENFAGFGDAWLGAVEAQQLEEAKQLAGVCASVRVRIEQELTLTRVGFEARLDIANDGDFPLESVTVSLRATPFDNITQDSTALFVFDEPELTDVTSVDGGTIDAKTNARVTWLILPLTEAAPIFETKYDISGVMQYTIEGIEYIQNLAPDTITVRPDPQLYLKYFHSRDAFSDDPFTIAIEPAIPFQLGLLIENRGYGDAQDVEIVSSQPEIVENEKGLLVEFTIIGSRRGNTPTASRTLNVNFGDIRSRSNAVGVWDMVSTIRGKFSNFSATFQYRGPINDDRLSLIESVEIYDLTHIVRVDGDHPMATGLGYVDDGLDDFLVNLRPDTFYIPDTVFTSDTREDNFTVGSILHRAHIMEIHYIQESDTVTVTVGHNLTIEETSLLTDWVYIRFDDPMGETDYILQTATRTDPVHTLKPQYNSWQTSWTDYLLDGGLDVLNHVHLFDFGVAPIYNLVYKKQQPVTNLRIADTTETTLQVAWDMPPGASSSYVLMKPASLGDQYYKTAKGFTQINSLVIRNLAPAQTYTVRVFTGREGNYERQGAEVSGSTMGESLCGNNEVDLGEECDDGALNGDTLQSNCTEACVKFVPSQETESEVPSAQPSSRPSASSSPSVQPSRHPSTNPSAMPSPEGSGSPSDGPSSQPSAAPSTEPSATPSSTPSESATPSSVPSAVPSEPPSAVPSVGPSGRPSADPSGLPSSAPSPPGGTPPSSEPRIVDVTTASWSSLLVSIQDATGQGGEAPTVEVTVDSVGYGPDELLLDWGCDHVDLEPLANLERMDSGGGGGGGEDFARHVQIPDEVGVHPLCVRGPPSNGDGDGGDGGTSSSSLLFRAPFSAVVYDADSYDYVVAGSGWITSPPGTVRMDGYGGGPGEEGGGEDDDVDVGTFAFHRLHHSAGGEGLPPNVASFSLRTADVDFVGTGMAGLRVVGTSAKLTGYGTVNGSDDVSFAITAVDGGEGTDEFRIQIMDKTTGAVIYDNVLIPTCPKKKICFEGTSLDGSSGEGGVIVKTP